MNNILSLDNLMKSGNPLIWVDTKEYERVQNIISSLCNKSDKTLYLWDIDQGIHSNEEDVSDNNPFEFLKEQVNSVLIMNDLHTDIKEVKNWRALINTIDSSSKNGNSIIIVSPIINIPIEISHYITLTKLLLPSLEELIDITTIIATKNKIELEEDEIKNIAIKGLGLTEYEFKTAIYTSMSYSGGIYKDSIFEIKKQLIEKNDSIRVYDSKKGFDGLCGMDNMKNFAKQMVGSGQGKGILILGVAGGGKTEFAKRLGHETDRITITLDFGSLMGSYVGETESKTKEALNLIDSVNQSIVFIDEIEKSLSGVSSGGDSVSKRQGGQFLKWLQDKTSDSYVVATANNINSLPPEYLRSGRWDAIFFVDMPTLEVRQNILEIYRKVYNISSTIDMDKLNYTGAEIENMCRLASNLNITLEEAKEYICPILITDKTSIDELRKFAKTRAVMSDIVKDNNNNSIKRI